MKRKIQKINERKNTYYKSQNNNKKKFIAKKENKNMYNN